MGAWFYVIGVEGWWFGSRFLQILSSFIFLFNSLGFLKGFFFPVQVSCAENVIASIFLCETTSFICIFWQSVSLNSFHLYTCTRMSYVIMYKKYLCSLLHFFLAFWLSLTQVLSCLIFFLSFQNIFASLCYLIVVKNKQFHILLIMIALLQILYK